MSIIWTIIIGLIVGVIAKFLVHGTGPSGCVPTALLGIAGSFVALGIGRFLGWYKEGQTAGFISSIIGAVILLWLYKLYLKHKAG